MQKLKIILNSSGSALVAAVVFAAVFSIITVGTVRLTSQASDMLKRDTDVIKTYWANESGVRVALRYLSRINNPGAIHDNLSSIGPINGYTPAVTIASATTGAGTFTYSITSSTTLPNTSPAIKNENVLQNFRLNTMQHWTYFEKSTSNASAWVRMVVDGDFHSNGYIKPGITMQAFPHVTGKTTTSGRLENPSSYTYDRPNYPGLYKKGIPRFDPETGNPWYGYYDNPKTVAPTSSNWLETRFPDYSRIGAVNTAPMEPCANTFNGATIIRNDGKYNCRIGIKIDNKKYNVYKWNSTTTSGSWELKQSNVSIESNPIIKTKGDTYVFGTLDGRLTIASDTSRVGSTVYRHDIYIAGNITYANMDLSSSNPSDDVLALVSEWDIVIPNSSDLSGHSFVNNGGTIYGSLFATKGGLKVLDKENYTTMRKLTLNGGLLIDYMDGTFNLGYKKVYYNCWSGGYWGPYCYNLVPDATKDYGIEGVYNKDQRFINNTAVAPGIPFARSQDEELSIEGTVVFMNIFTGGTWKNEIKKGS